MEDFPVPDLVPDIDPEFWADVNRYKERKRKEFEEDNHLIDEDFSDSFDDNPGHVEDDLPC